MLTKKQHELLMFIHERLKETGVSPSFDEMKEALDLASKSGIHRLITALEERGFLRRLLATCSVELHLTLTKNVQRTSRNVPALFAGHTGRGTRHADQEAARTSDVHP